MPICFVSRRALMSTSAMSWSKKVGCGEQKHKANRQLSASIRDLVLSSVLIHIRPKMPTGMVVIQNIKQTNRTHIDGVIHEQVHTIFIRGVPWHLFASSFDFPLYTSDEHGKKTSSGMIPSGCAFKKDYLRVITKVCRSPATGKKTLQASIFIKVRVYKQKTIGSLKGSVERSRHERHFCPLLPYFFTFLTSNFPTLFVLLYFIAWSGSF